MWISKIIDWFNSSTHSWNQTQDEVWLSQSADLAELESRMHQLDNRNGNKFTPDPEYYL